MALSEKIELLGKGLYKNIPDELTLASIPTISELDYVSGEDFDETMINKILPKAVEEDVNFRELLEIDYQWICRCLRILNFGPYHTTNAVYCGSCGERSYGEYLVDLRTIECKVLPEGFVNDGTAYKRNDYANLFNVIGNKYNNGVVLFDRFKVPNLQSRFPLGASSVYSLGDTGGEKEVTLTKEKIPSHNHTITKIGGHNDGSGGTYKTFSTLDTSKTETGNRTVDVAVSAMTDNCGGQPHNNMPPYLVVNFIIKYK